MTWIKVSDELPKKEGRYLCWADGWNWVGPAICHFKIDSDGYYWHKEDSGNEPELEPLDIEYGDILPTHWSVLELPKEAS